MAAMLTFAHPSDPVLTKTASPILEEEFSTQSLSSLINDMLNLATIEQSDGTKYVLVGLAAPQLGVSKRIILVATGANGKGAVSHTEAYINPEIIHLSDEKTTWYEACYSTGDVAGIVERPKTVTIRARKPDGTHIEETHHDYVARIFQHEIDHLNGIRFPTLTSTLHKVDPKEMHLYRNQENWRNWPKTCTHADYEELLQLGGNSHP
jgi:peptide deformylase